MTIDVDTLNSDSDEDQLHSRPFVCAHHGSDRKGFFHAFEPKWNHSLRSLAEH
jgi:hypothetical protein